MSLVAVTTVSPPPPKEEVPYTTCFLVHIRFTVEKGPDARIPIKTWESFNLIPMVN